MIDPKDAEQRGQRWWYQRETVRTLKSQNWEPEQFDDLDKRDNDNTRLPSGEAVHLGGLVLAEAFTPSTVSSLFETLRGWPTELEKRRDEWLLGLELSRGGGWAGWQSLGIVRRAGGWPLGLGYQDSDLPAQVEAVWLQLSYLTPALAIVVATLSLTEDSGDLSGVLKRDYKTSFANSKLRVAGPLGAARERVPWARPKRYSLSQDVKSPEDQKKALCDARIMAIETAACSWFYKRFSGRFSAAEREEQPVTRVFLTKKSAPFEDQSSWLRPLELDRSPLVWRSTEPEGWWLTEDRAFDRPRHRRHLLAARRSDVAGQGLAEHRESNWSIARSIHTNHAPLAARHAVLALLALHSNRIAKLRDQTGSRRRLRRLVKEARVLDRHLIGDGLDAETIASDLDELLGDLTQFRRGLAEFTEYREHLPAPVRAKREPLDYLRHLRDEIRHRSGRLALDAANTTANIRASAELRQAIASTRLQRVTLALSVLAVAVALVSLLSSR